MPNATATTAAQPDVALRTIPVLPAPARTYQGVMRVLTFVLLAALLAAVVGRIAGVLDGTTLLNVGAALLALLAASIYAAGRPDRYRALGLACAGALGAGALAAVFWRFAWGGSGA
ncbi:MAG TPA: hypothetical protein VF832_08210, partial [Longimicrobiales bacterium]